MAANKAMQPDGRFAAAADRHDVGQIPPLLGQTMTCGTIV